MNNYENLDVAAVKSYFIFSGAQRLAVGFPQGASPRRQGPVRALVHRFFLIRLFSKKSIEPSSEGIDGVVFADFMILRPDLDDFTLGWIFKILSHIKSPANKSLLTYQGKKEKVGVCEKTLTFCALPKGTNRCAHYFL